MNIAVRYQSVGGNTKAVAQVIADVCGVRAYPISEPCQDIVDLLFIGGGAYMWDADMKLVDYLKTLKAENVKQIVAFTTSGTMDIVLKRIVEYAGLANIPVNDRKLCVRMMLKGHGSFGLVGGILTDKQISNVQAFTKEVLANY